MHDPFLQKTVAQIVRDNYRTAGVFKSVGINYCCGGGVPLAEACALRGIAVEEVTAQLRKAVQTVQLPANLPYNSWKLDFLVDYIINVHHAYLKDALPKLEVNLAGFVNGHKKKMPYLEDILTQFQALSALLQHQMEQEEEIVFPYIKQVEAAYRRNETYGSLLVKTLRKPLQIEDAVSVSNGLSALRSLTDHYQFSDDACTNHRVVFQQLEELDNDLVQHKHLENNILFPRTAETEQSLLQGVNS
jgi:regulator of cell morphogenesis and NO signaling